MFINVNGLKIHYEKYGSGPSLIMVHGNGEDISIFDKTISLLKNHFTIYAPDLPGHGQSDSVSDFHYNDFASYIYGFIKALNLENSIFYGFSDGGITGLILASEYENIFSKLIISGVNLNPEALKLKVRFGMLFEYMISSDKKILMMLKEPHIKLQDIAKIEIPVYITAGQNDVIPLSHSQYINSCIKNSKLTIFNGHSHGSYIIHSEEIGRYIVNICS